MDALPAPNAGPPEPGQNTLAAAGVDGAMMARVRARCQPGTWAAFLEVAVQGRPAADVAADLGTTAGGARQAAHRVRQEFRAEINHHRP